MSVSSGEVAIDSSVLLDVVIEGEPHADTSRQALNKLARRGGLILSPVVLSEVAVHFKDRQRLRDFLDDKPFQRVEPDDDVAWWASRFFRRYVRQRETGENGSRRKILPDFFIAAHAHVHADHLVTRDTDFQKSYFKELSVLTVNNVLES
jgi:predicted nucleic acid-binding protein